ncbi:MAG: hypothetical protein JXM69_14025 [Anaerolineae bacterium]|nr:hypothetical protein [Anaerolineae bacterium]
MLLGKFEDYLDQPQRELFARLNSPAQIQAFLDETLYSAEDANRCPVRVLQERVAHCLDGALFAAAALRRIGYPPLIIDMLPDPGQDDDHVLAIYRREGFWGAVAKSNFVGLRFREAIYRSLRELVLSYFEDFYNVNGEKTLQSYTRPLNLERYDRVGWMWRDEGVDIIEQRLGKLKRIELVSQAMVSHFVMVDKLSYKAGMLGVNEAGLYQPRR